MTMNYGATPADWDHLSLVLGLTQDLLPVVSNPNAVISPDSKLKGVGKTPSRYNGKRQAAGIADWTNKYTTDEEVARWRKEPDYGICLQTRHVRAIDIDVEDTSTANLIIEHISGELHHRGLPTRFRANSGKCLLAFRLPGDMPKRVIKLDGGIIEFLATGQQFIACGTHTSGARYEWLSYDENGENLSLPNEIPELTLDEFERVWQHLAHTFGTSATVSTSPTKAKVLSEAITKDPVATHLIDQGWVKSQEKDGRLHIRCPFEAGHSTESSISATTYFPANTGGYQFGHFDCRHASCEHRTDDDFKAEIGIPISDPFDDFDVINGTQPAEMAETKPPRFGVVPAHEFSAVQPAGWIVKNVIPKAEMGVIYGESGSGKTFLILDIVGAIARGTEWRGHRVTQGEVVYICAEGAGGMRSRLRAYSNHHDVDLAGLRLGVIPDAPNFMQVADVKAVIEAILAYGRPAIVVVDTFAQVMAGSNENAGEDVGKALAHCKQIHKRTGAMVLLVHHAGKDASKGARGWSGLRAAADVEIEVSRSEEDRVATLTKAKDGVDGTEFGFKLKTVVLGVDEDGDDITSCVVEAAEVQKRAVQKVKKTGGNEKLVLQCLSSMLEVGDDRVAYTDLLAVCISQMVPPQEGKRDRRSQLVSQAIDSLRDKGDLEVDNGFLKFPSEKEG